MFDVCTNSTANKNKKQDANVCVPHLPTNAVFFFPSFFLPLRHIMWDMWDMWDIDIWILANHRGCARLTVFLTFCSFLTFDFSHPNPRFNTVQLTRAAEIIYMFNFL